MNQEKIESRKRILLVGMADSVHFARWLAQFDQTEIDFLIVSSSPHRKIHPEIKRRIQSRDHGSSRIAMPFISQYLSLPMWILDRGLNNFFRGGLLAILIKRFKPDIVHAHELQNAGYMSTRAYRMLSGIKPRLIATNYGSEIVWFQSIPSHERKLRLLFETAEYFSAECLRDYELASRFNGRLKLLPLMPVAGGMAKNSKPELERRVIAVKGYENKWGKALAVIQLLESMAESLESYEVIVFSSNATVLKYVKSLRQRSDLKISAFPKGALKHEDVQEIFRKSLIYIGHSLSDGISTSMLEAMAMGAIPVQTCTSCADEWVENGKNGFIFEPNDMANLELILGRIIGRNFDSNDARAQNYKTIDDRYQPMSLAAVAFGYYEEILGKL